MLACKHRFPPAYALPPPPVPCPRRLIYTERQATHLIHLVPYNHLDHPFPTIRINLLEPFQQLVECLAGRDVVDC
jgi:hypothetical protein